MVVYNEKGATKITALLRLSHKKIYKGMMATLLRGRCTLSYAGAYILDPFNSAERLALLSRAKQHPKSRLS